ncbi:MAG: formimidoylglutamase [Flavobacteriaceae bacterium]|nr:formimidoylglutamase [Flavobacteriaceae bacterium]MDG1961660.1 formimidoylglutamase [Flavobacteriaceae bacterium]
MIQYLTPVDKSVVAHREILPNGVLGKQINIYQNESNFPQLEGVKFVLLGVRECRNDVDYMGGTLNFDAVRKSFYALYPGNWPLSLVDLGDIMPGHEPADTYFALKSVVAELLELGILPIILGGSQDLLYAHYRAFDQIITMLNLVNIDHRFDLGDAQAAISNKSYVGKIIVDEPYNLFNYSVLGFQSYLNPPEEIALMDKLHFDACRLGALTHDLSLAEPILRNASLVSMDVSCIKSGDLSGHYHKSPNGFDSREICAMARYAGISNRVKSFGLYELKTFDSDERASNLIAQILWYFIEGVSFRVDDEDFYNDRDFITYSVPIDDLVLVFKKSNKTGRWWVELPFNSKTDNNLHNHALLPCTYDEYIGATNQEIPERWLKARLKNEV